MCVIVYICTLFVCEDGVYVCLLSCLCLHAIMFLTGSDVLRLDGEMYEHGDQTIKTIIFPMSFPNLNKKDCNNTHTIVKTLLFSVILQIWEKKCNAITSCICFNNLKLSWPGAMCKVFSNFTENIVLCNTITDGQNLFDDRYTVMCRRPMRFYRWPLCVTI